MDTNDILLYLSNELIFINVFYLLVLLRMCVCVFPWLDISLCVVSSSEYIKLQTILY